MYWWNVLRKYYFGDLYVFDWFFAAVSHPNWSASDETPNRIAIPKLCVSFLWFKLDRFATNLDITQLPLFIKFPERTNCYGRWESWVIGNVFTNFLGCRRAIFFRWRLLTGDYAGVTAYLGPQIAVIPAQLPWKCGAYTVFV